jgi:hypothetical protein
MKLTRRSGGAQSIRHVSRRTRMSTQTALQHGAGSLPQGVAVLVPARISKKHLAQRAEGLRRVRRRGAPLGGVPRRPGCSKNHADCLHTMAALRHDSPRTLSRLCVRMWRDSSFGVSTASALSAGINSSRARRQTRQQAPGRRQEALGLSVTCAWLRTCHVVDGTAPCVPTQQRLHFLAVRWP